MKPGLISWAFKRLEPYDGKLSSTVLRGRRNRQRFLCYPTLKTLLDGFSVSSCILFLMTKERLFV